MTIITNPRVSMRSVDKMKWRRIKAVFLKQIADTAHNRGIFIQFLVFPILMVLLLFALPGNANNDKTLIIMIMSTSFTGTMPILTVHNIIKEDKIQNTLRILIMSTVKPLEYLIGITAYILFISLINVFIFGLLGGLSGLALLRFIFVLMLGIITTLLFGSAMSIYSTSHSGAGSLIVFVSMLNGIIPMLGMFNESIQKFTSFLYTYQINNLIGDIYGNHFNWNRLFIVFLNLAVFFLLFILSFKKNRFYEG